MGFPERLIVIFAALSVVLSIYLGAETPLFTGELWAVAARTMPLLIAALVLAFVLKPKKENLNEDTRRFWFLTYVGVFFMFACGTFAWSAFFNEGERNAAALIAGGAFGLAYFINALVSRFKLDGEETKFEKGVDRGINVIAILLVIGCAALLAALAYFGS